MLFKTIEDEATLSGKRIQSIFGQVGNQISAMFSTKTMDFSGFNTSIIKDTDAINNYVMALQSGMSQEQAFKSTMVEASVAAQTYANSVNTTNASVDGFKTYAAMSQVSLEAQNKTLGNVRILLNEYNSGMENCKLSQDDFISAVGKSNSALGKYLAGLNGGQASMKGYITSLVGAKVASIALQAATMALNMALTMGISAAIQGLITLFNNWIHAAKNASKAADELAGKNLEESKAIQKEITQLDKLIDRYKELGNSDTTDINVRSEIKDIQAEITDLVGSQASNLDLVNGKLDEEIKKLNEIKKQEADKAVESAVSAYHSAKDASDKAIGDDSYGFFDGYAYTGHREKDVEKILKDAGYGTSNVASGGFFGNTLFVMDSFDKDMNMLEGAKEKAEYLSEMIDVIKRQYADYASSDLYNGLVAQRDAYDKYVESVNTTAKTLADSVISAATFDEELSSITVNSAETFDKYRQKLLDIVKNSPDLSEALKNGSLTEKDLEKQVNDYLSLIGKFSNYYKEWNKNTELDAKIKAYNDLTKQILECSDAQEKINLLAEQNTLGKEIEDIAVLATQYDDLTAAYNRWQDAQSTENEGAKYDSIAKGLEEIKKIYDQGLIGTDDFKTAVQLMSNQDLTNATPEQLKAAFEESYPSMQKYFKDGSEGCEAFLNKLSEIDESWAHVNENGDWEINFNDEEVAKELDISVGAVQAIMRKLKEFGFDINLSTSIESLADLKSATESANDTLKELKENGKIDIDFEIPDFNANSTNIDDLILQIDSATQILDTFKNEDGTVNLSVEGAQEIKTILAALIMQKQQVSEPAIIELNFDAETAKTEIESAALLVNDFRTKYHELEVKIATGEDTSALQTEIQNIVTQIDKVPDEIKTKLGLDSDEFTTAVDTLTQNTVDVKAGITLDDGALATFNATLLSISPKMLVEAGLDDTLIKDYNPDDQYEKIGTVKYKVDDTLVKKYNPDDIHRTVYYKVVVEGDGTARGTAFAQGDWGTSKSGIALGGELGRELVVRNGKFFTIGDEGAEFFQYQKGDIIFNAEQTKQIFEKGKISSGNRRGRALVEGTAFAGGQTTGSGRFYTGSSISSTSNASTHSAKSSSSGSASTASSSSSSSKKSNEETEFERQYKYHQHLLAMDRETTQEYLDWLVAAYKEAYNAGQIELDDFYKYEEEVYDKSKAIFSDFIKDCEHSIAMWENQGGNTQNIIDEYRSMQQAVHNQAEYYRSLGLSENHDLIQDLQKQWWDFEKKLVDTIKDTYDEIVRSAESSIDLMKEHMKDFVTVFDDGSAEKYSSAIVEKYKGIQDTLHEEAETLRALGYSEDSKEIQDLQKQWWDAEHNKNSSLKDAFDRRLKLSEDYIEKSKLLGWENGDNEIKARERILNWLSSEYYRSLFENEEEWEKAYLEQLKDYNSTVISTIDKIYDDYSDVIKEVNDEIDDQIAKEQALLDIKTKQYDAINKLADAQHEADKAIADSRISKSYLSDREYKLIYNEEDYAAVTRVINNIDSDISRLTKNFNKQIKDAYANGQEYLIKNITAEYERQVELKMQELEIAQAELDITKKQTELNNVLQERNIRQLVEKDGKLQWEWVADTDKVRAATEALSEAEYKHQKAIDEKNQQINLNAMQENIDDFTDQQERNNKLVEDLGDTIKNIKKTIDKIENPIEGLTIDITTLKDKGVANFSKAIDSMITKLGSIAINSASSAKQTTSSSSQSYGTGKVTYDKNVDYMAKAQDAISRGDTAAAQKAIAQRNAKIDGEGLSYSKVTVNDVKKSMGYASGTTNAKKGLHEVDENGGETYVTREGTFHNFEGGEFVFDHDKTKALYDFASKLTALSDNSPIIMPISKNDINNTLSALQNQNNDNKGNSYSFGDIIVNNPADHNAFVKELTNAIRKKTV